MYSATDLRGRLESGFFQVSVSHPTPRADVPRHIGVHIWGVTLPTSIDPRKRPVDAAPCSWPVQRKENNAPGEYSCKRFAEPSGQLPLRRRNPIGWCQTVNHREIVSLPLSLRELPRAEKKKLAQTFGLDPKASTNPWVGD
jgi:hypothetical protein